MESSSNAYTFRPHWVRYVVQRLDWTNNYHTIINKAWTNRG